MKNYADLGGCYPLKPKAEADNTLLDLINLNSMFNYLRKIDGGRSISWGGDIV